MKNVQSLPKKALTRPVGEHSDIPYVKDMEEELLGKNQTGLVLDLEDLAVRQQHLPSNIKYLSDP